MVAERSLKGSTLSTPLGTMSVVVSGKGLMALDFSARVPKQLHGVRVEHDDADALIKQTKKQLAEYFAGRRLKFDIPLDLVGTPFQVLVWKTLAKVRFGTTISYAQEAALVGKPNAFRAVGGANGKNPIPIVLPCHRIISADGSLGGFSAGLPKKKWLLQHELDVLASEKQQPRSRVR